MAIVIPTNVIGIRAEGAAYSSEYESYAAARRANDTYDGVFYFTELAVIGEGFYVAGSTTFPDTVEDVLGFASMSYDLDRSFSITLTNAGKEYIEARLEDARLEVVYSLEYKAQDPNVPAFSFGPQSMERLGYSSPGAYAVREGFMTSAEGNQSHAEGRYSSAAGNTSHAEGSGTSVTADCGHAEGLETTVTGYAGHAEGSGSIARGEKSHAEGYGSHANGSCSHVEGEVTTASGASSHAEGYGTTAGGDYSHAQNRGTKALSDYQTAIGKYNVEDANDEYAFIIGNGAGASFPSNAMGVTWDGDIEAAGIFESRRTTPEIRLTTPATSSYPDDVDEYSSYIRAYDTNSVGYGHNLVINSGGNTIIGSGESAQHIYDNLDGNQIPTATTEAMVVASDSEIDFYTYANTFENRARTYIDNSGNVILKGRRWGSTNTVGRVYMDSPLGAMSKSAQNDLTASAMMGEVLFRDANNVAAGAISNQLMYDSDSTNANAGATRTYMQARSMKSDGTMSSYNFFGVYARKDGTAHYGCSSPANFRSDLDLAQASVVGARVTKDQSTAVSIADSAWKNICSVSLPAGTWVIEATGQFAANATGRRYIAISEASAAASATAQRQTGNSMNAVSGGTTCIHTGCTKVFTATTTVYLVGYQSSGAALNTYGCITAVRIK